MYIVNLLLFSILKLQFLINIKNYKGKFDRQLVKVIANFSEQLTQSGRKRTSGLVITIHLYDHSYVTSFEKIACEISATC